MFEIKKQSICFTTEFMQEDKSDNSVNSVSGCSSKVSELSLAYVLNLFTPNLNSLNKVVSIAIVLCSSKSKLS